jgi:hypothetical protein
MQQGAVSGRQILCPKQLQLQLASSSFRRSMGEASRIDSAKEQLQPPFHVAPQSPANRGNLCLGTGGTV